MDSRAEPRPSLNRLSVDVERHRRGGFDRHFANARDAAADDLVRGACEQMRHRADRPKTRALFDDDKIELAVVDACAGRDERAVAELRGVGERDQHSARFDGRPARRDPIRQRHVAGERARSDAGVAEKASAPG